jgi:hypothetical protein
MSMCTIVKDILWNFNILSSLENHQTLYVEGDKLFLEDRMFQFIRRTFSGDSRNRIINSIEKSLNMFDEVLQVYKIYMENNNKSLTKEINQNIFYNLQKLTQQKEKVVNGLITLRTYMRYIKDQSFLFSVDDFINRLNQLNNKANDLMKSYENVYK